MTPRAFVTRIGALSAVQANVSELRHVLRTPSQAFHPVASFEAKGDAARLPVGEVALGDAPVEAKGLPRTHLLALAAAREAVGEGPPPDAIVVGTTTGGVAATEDGLKQGISDPSHYRFHGLETVGACLASAFDVRGPVLTVSTACSSSAVALAIGVELLRTGLAKRVLAGGADSLCRLTLYGFNLLQLVDPRGTTPLDASRNGMTVGEGAAFLMLESSPSEGTPLLAELAGYGLSCDAYHATKPHPEGLGAVLAMERALSNAAILPADLDYANVHGTGTVDNDAAELCALHKLVEGELPALSSTKGMTGHTLGAAGALEAVICALAIFDGILPANVGLQDPDPALRVHPVREPRSHAVHVALSNSFGFGGNNASLVLRSPPHAPPPGTPRALPVLRVLSACCLSGHGAAMPTWDAFLAGKGAGRVPTASLSSLPASRVRRLKRLPRMILELANQAYGDSGLTEAPDCICVGTAWGPLEETHQFLAKLFESGEQFSSPLDFVGSVHNAPAGQAALLLGAHGPNVTCSSGDRSFEHAVLSACLFAKPKQSALLMAAESWCEPLSPLLDPRAGDPSDGGAALVVVADDGEAGPRLRYLGEERGDVAMENLLGRLGPVDRFGAVLVGVPDRELSDAQPQLDHLRKWVGAVPIVEYRKALGEYPSVSATATVMALKMIHSGVIPNHPAPLSPSSVLLVTLGQSMTALEVFK